MNPFRAETTTVYRATTGRRYLTKRGAVMASARHALEQKWGCNCHEPEYYPDGRPLADAHYCDIHDPEQKIVKRVARLWLRWEKNGGEL